AIGPRSNTRVVGVKVQGPNGSGATGCVVVDRGNNVAILGNEFTLCGGDPAHSGNPADGDSLYHVLYIAGFPACGPCTGESNREVGWNYFHSNNALRAINIYNDNQGSGSNWISGHVVHHNVVLNQTGAGIAVLMGVVGENWVYNNLVINAGLKWADGSQSQGFGIHLSAQDPSGESSGMSPLLHVFNNTVLNAGQAGNSGNGAFRLMHGGTIHLHNTLTYQASGPPYIPSGSVTPGAGQATQTLWYGAGSAPSFDTAAVNADPRIVSVTSPYDLHLQATSPAIM